MGERLNIRLFKCPSEKHFRDVVSRVTCTHGGDLRWDAAPQFRSDDCRTSHQNDVHSLYLPYQENAADSHLCAKIGKALDSAWIEIRVNEGSHWDYSLFMADKHIDKFSTLPEYWGDMQTLTADDQKQLDSWRGNPSALASIWSIEQSRIDGYLKPWGFRLTEEEGAYDTLLRGKAYQGDSFEMATSGRCLISCELWAPLIL
jgi:hypothetical protein